MRRFLKWAAVACVLLALGAALGDLGASKSATPSASVDEDASARTPVPTSTPTPTPTVSKRDETRAESAKATRTPTQQTPSALTPLVSCDANVQAKAPSTTCPFAENVFYEYYRETYGHASDVNVRAWSPAAARFYRVRCSGEISILCRAGDGATVKFPSSAVSTYDDKQAAAYASTHATGHPVSSGHSGGSSESYEGNSNGQLGDPGEHYSPNYEDDSSDDLGGGNEIPNYENGTGYRVQCADGMYSHSGGRPGACSGHGGVG